VVTVHFSDCALAGCRVHADTRARIQPVIDVVLHIEVDLVTFGRVRGILRSNVNYGVDRCGLPKINDPVSIGA